MGILARLFSFLDFPSAHVVILFLLCFSMLAISPTNVETLGPNISFVAFNQIRFLCRICSHKVFAAFSMCKAIASRSSQISSSFSIS